MGRRLVGLATIGVLLFLYIPIGIIVLYAFNASKAQTWPITEWTTSWFSATAEGTQSPCCAPAPEPGERFPRRVIKGGSHLCAPNYCLRYRPAARQGEAVDTSTNHIGFRCIIRPD